MHPVITYKYLFPLVVCACIFNAGALAQYEEKNFTLYTKLDGLSQNYVTAIAQDSTGYIWIATSKGLNRFDGKSFISFFKNASDSYLPENFIISLRVQEKNELVGTTIAGAFAFNALTGYHRTFIVPSDSIIYFWANWVFDAIKDHKGNYILSTKTGLFIFNDSGRVICRYDRYRAADEGRKEIWFGNWLQLLSNGTVFQKNDLSGSVYDPEKNRIDTFYLQQKFKNIHYASTQRGADTSGSLNGQSDEELFVNPILNRIEIINLLGQAVYYSHLPKSIIADLDWHSKLFHINDSIIAVTSKIGGFYTFYYNRRAKTIGITGRKYFASKYCTTIFKDADGRLWVGTNDGLYRQNLRNPFFSTEDLASQWPSIVNTGLQSIYAEKNKLFLGLRSEGGLLLLDNKTKKIIRHFSFERWGQGSSSIVFIFSYHPDTLWLGTGSGIIWLNKRNFSSGKLTNIPGQPVWMNSERCRSYLQDSRGNIWLSFGRLNSVLLFKREPYTFTEIVSPLLKITFCFSLIEDKRGNIWMAGDGFCRWNIKKQAIDTLIRYTSLRKSQVKFMEILDADNADNLWLFLGFEIIQYNYSSNKMWLRLPENNILDGALVTSSAIIKDHIWMCLANGISALNINDYSVRQFNYADGLPDAVVTSVRRGSFYDKSDNVFYAGAGRFLISFVPDVSLPYKEPIPKLFVDLVDRDGKVISQTTSAVRLPYSQNSLQIRFNAINYTDPEDNRFAYRMITDGDNAWHDLNMQSSIGLNNLSPGKYNVQVKLSSVNNRWLEQIKDISIVIVPPFWKTTWFIVSVAAVLMTIFYLFYHIRIGEIRQKANVDKLLAQTEMKALHAQMNPHFIFNCLNSIREMILNNNNQEASHYLARFAQLIRITLDHSRQHFVSLHNTMDYLTRYIEMEQVRNSHFTSRILADDELDLNETVLPPMLIQPFVENALWHGTANNKKNINIKIDFKRENDQLICLVDDNGIGIEKSLQDKKNNAVLHHSVGIDNIKNRIRLLNEKYHVRCSVIVEDKINLPGYFETGTLVTLQLPLEISNNE
jgi:Histidine kinase/Y_Y_Y domain/Two component regulator propeller